MPGPGPALRPQARQEEPGDGERDGSAHPEEKKRQAPGVPAPAATAAATTPCCLGHLPSPSTTLPRTSESFRIQPAAQASQDRQEGDKKKSNFGEAKIGSSPG